MQRTHFTAGYIKYIYISVIVFFQNRYPIMVKCLNIGRSLVICIAKKFIWTTLSAIFLNI